MTDVKPLTVDDLKPKAEKTTRVSVHALQVHTYDGREYQPGDTYDIDEQVAESVEVQGKALRLDQPGAKEKIAALQKAEKDAQAAPSAGTYARKDLKA